MRFIVQNHVVADTGSGLMWTRNAALETLPQTWSEALAFIGGMNRDAQFGFADWRLPNRRELFSLIRHEQAHPALPQHHPFIDVFEGYYWTSTSCARLPHQAWYLHLGGGRLFTGMKQGSCMIWPVRSSAQCPMRVPRTGQRECYALDGSPVACAGSGQDAGMLSGLAWPQPRFEVVGEEVLDRLSGLIWQRQADRSGPVSWADALAAARAANSGLPPGDSRWRLPTVAELESLCDMSTHSPALPHGHPFEQVRPFYWSATTSRYDQRYAWVLYLQDGAVGVGYKPLPEFYLWLVRDGNTDEPGKADFRDGTVKSSRSPD